MAEIWLALIIGNSRLHWAQFAGDSLQKTWDEPHLPKPESVENQPLVPSPHPLWIVSVVPEQTRFWMNYPQVRVLTLDDVPLRGMYSTLGLDRALAVWGAIATVGSPVLVIDAGTSLTFTGADANHQLVGGAILPGLRLQVEALGRKTAALPTIELGQQSNTLPGRWALETEGAIASGILHTLLAGLQSFIADWRYRFPQSQVVMTGGDGQILYAGLQQQAPTLAASIKLDLHLIFKGIQTIKCQKSN
ncbi:MAG: pantothenate kinase [Oscillatoriales cyanobacterium C42_A2020_001]|nr:pantothenate kinase [Leptolyngbyaceae cyanobacterium C42_A2020_001]